MTNLKLGDLFTINTSKGKALLQFVHNNKDIGELIRVLPGLYPDSLPELEKFIQKPELFLVHFPLKAAKKKNIIEHIGNYKIPNHFSIPRFMRETKKDKNGNFISWQIIDYTTWKREPVTKLSDEQKQLSPWGIWNDTLLIDRLTQDWTLDNWN